MSVLKYKNLNDQWVGVPVIKGEKGPKGDPGDDYVLTTADKTEIAASVIADGTVAQLGDLSAKADLVDGKVPAAQLPSQIDS